MSKMKESELEAIEKEQKEWAEAIGPLGLGPGHAAPDLGARRLDPPAGAAGPSRATSADRAWRNRITGT